MQVDLLTHASALLVFLRALRKWMLSTYADTINRWLDLAWAQIIAGSGV